MAIKDHTDGLPDVALAYFVVHTHCVDADTARAELLQAKAEHDAALATAERTRDHLYGAVKNAAPVLKQVEIVKITGWTREHIRRIATSAESSTA